MNIDNKRYFGIALDPIYIGTGGYRLGRVDNTIVREPGTNIPKIPGTSIEGIARTYSAYIYAKNDHSKLKCAGKDTEGKEQCGKHDCPICITFGFSRKDSSLHGMAQFSDARILFFPVHSMIGPVWVTCLDVLNEFGIEETVSPNKIKTSMDVPENKLNLGWLLLEKEDSISINSSRLDCIPAEIINKLVLVSAKLFSQIINSNLEVRTSVAIDPRTGAAEERALFTYEAIPRSTILWFDVAFYDPSYFRVDNNSISINQKEVKKTIENGLKLFEVLGVGGMGTRGFGRLKILNLDKKNGGT